LQTINQPKYKNHIFILIIPFHISKSNTWVSLLSFSYLKDVIHDIYSNITDVYNDTIDSKSPLYKKKVKCIICDDCSYTGDQLSIISSFNYEKINYIDKSAPPDEHSNSWLAWHERTNREAEEYIKKVSIDIFSVDLVLPYMSTLAQASLRKIPLVNVSRNCYIFTIFSQRINMDRIPMHIINEFKKTFQYHKNISAIYFDHKVADSVSTFHKIYLLSPLFNCSLSDLTIPFIDGCDLKKIPQNLDIYNYYIDISDKIKTCPPTFYKSIKYTYKKKPLKGDINLLDIIKD